MRDQPALRFVLAILGALALLYLAGCSPAPIPLAIAASEPVAVLAPAWVAPAEVRRAAPVDPRSGWCEPLDPAICERDSDCPGTRCSAAWWMPGAKVCARPMPDRDERAWRVARLRVFVDARCSGACQPEELHRYLRVLALRESTYRPWKRSRLAPDLEANRVAWAKHRERFAANLASSDPDRWSTGLGYYAQIPALWLPRWGASAPPETLCGEVESTEAHLRAARDQIRKIASGSIACDGEPFTGTARDGGPSWYDASRANSGSLCPGSADDRRSYERRAEDAGFDPWVSIAVEQLGVEIPREGQDRVAAELRARMESVPRPRGR